MKALFWDTGQSSAVAACPLRVASQHRDKEREEVPFETSSLEL
jgi:hypothetical protein